MSLVYLLTTQPPLLWGNPAPLKWDEFCEQIKALLPGQASACLAFAQPPYPPLGEATQRWREYAQSLAHELAKARSKRLRRNDQSLSLEYFPQCPSKDLEEILQAPNPLEAQKSHSSLLWEEAERQEAPLGYCLERLAFYALKLSLLLRLDAYHEPQAREKLDFWLQEKITQQLRGHP